MYAMSHAPKSTGRTIGAAAAALALAVVLASVSSAVAAGRRVDGRKKARQSPLPADLARAWAGLPEHVKAAILALKASGAANVNG